MSALAPGQLDGMNMISVGKDESKMYWKLPPGASTIQPNLSYFYIWQQTLDHQLYCLVSQLLKLYFEISVWLQLVVLTLEDFSKKSVWQVKMRPIRFNYFQLGSISSIIISDCFYLSTILMGVNPYISLY